MSDNTYKSNYVNHNIFKGVRNGTSSPNDIDFVMDDSYNKKILFAEFKSHRNDLSTGQRKNCEFIIDNMKEKIKAHFVIAYFPTNVIYGVNEVIAKKAFVFKVYKKGKWKTLKKEITLKKYSKRFFK